MSDDLPIPPLEPTAWRDFDFRQTRPVYERPIGQMLVFQLTLEQYQLRMQHEALRLEREQHAQMMLEERAKIIQQQRKTIEDLLTQLELDKVPRIPALRQAYAEDRITLAEFERLVLHCIAAEE